MYGFRAVLAAIALFVFNFDGSALSQGEVTFLYPKSHSVAVYNYLDTINVSWTFLSTDTRPTLLDLRQSTGKSTLRYYIRCLLRVTSAGSSVSAWSIVSDESRLVHCQIPFDTDRSNITGPFSLNLISIVPWELLDSTAFVVTNRSHQGRVLWGASNGTGPLLAYNFSTTSKPPATSSSQQISLPSVSVLSGAPI